MSVTGTTQPPAEWLDALDVAAIFGTSRTWVYTLATRGQLPHYRFGGTIRFDPDDVAAYVAARRRGPSRADLAANAS